MDACGKYSYDGTIEGFMCVLNHCIKQRTMPASIRPELVICGRPESDSFIRIESDYRIANKMYKIIGRHSSPEVQQMVNDLFLTCIPNMEMDLFILSCKAIKYGAVIAEDYSDEFIRRVQFSIRDLYREAASIHSNLNTVDIDGVSFSVINPRNNVLPILRRPILNDPSYDDILIYDKRHKIALLRMNDTDMVLDTAHIPYSDLHSVNELYKMMWPYFSSDRSRLSINTYKEKADSLSKLWYIAG